MLHQSHSNMGTLIAGSAPHPTQSSRAAASCSKSGLGLRFRLGLPSRLLHHVLPSSAKAAPRLVFPPGGCDGVHLQPFRRRFRLRPLPIRLQLLALRRTQASNDPNSLSLCNFPNSDYSATPRLPYDIIEGKLICGSSFGWIALLDDSPIFSLYNPFIDVHMDLPPLFNLPWNYANGDGGFRVINLPDYFAWKLVLSSDPRIQSCTAMAFSHNYKRLIYCRPGEGSWTLLPPLLIDDDEVLDDILFYRGKFYVIRTYKLFVCNIGHDNAQVTQVLPMDPLFSDGKAREGCSRDKTSYLVDSSGDLLLVSVRRPHVKCTDPNCDVCDEFSFEVFRVDLDFGEMPNSRFSLFKLDSLGGRSLFLSYDSMSVSACNSPSCKGNSIYLILNGEAYMYGVFVFSMEDGSFSSVAGFSGVWHDSDYGSGTDTEEDTANCFSERSVRDFRFNWLTPSLC